MVASKVAADRLRGLVEKLIELKPAVERYEETENLLAGLMLCAEVGEIEIPGRGRVALTPNPSPKGRGGYGLVVEPEETPAATIIKIIPFKGLPSQ